MRILELLRENAVEVGVAPISDENIPVNLTEQELEFILEVVKQEPMSGQDLLAKVKDVVTDYSRSKDSLRLAAIRMHILVHGILPYNLVPHADWYFVPQTMVKFADDKGYDVSSNIAKAQREGQKRKLVKNRQEALDILGSYFKEIKGTLSMDSLNSLKQHREEVLELIQKGIPVEQAFDKFK